MAVAFDAAVSTPGAVNQGGIAWEHAVGDIANGILLIGIATGNGGASDGTIAPTVDGIDATLLRFQESTIDATFQVEVWYVLAPASGARAISWNRGSGVQFIAATSRSYSGVDQVDPFGAEDSTDATGNPVTVSSTVAALVDDMVVDWLVQHCNASRDVMAAAGQTERTDCFPLSNDNARWLKTSDKPGAASVTMTWANTGGFVGVTHYAVALNAAATGTEREALSCTPGAVAVTGQSATLRAHRRLVCSPGAIVLTGQAATLRTARRLEAQAGTVAVTGTQATLRAARQLVAQPGAVTITGVNATLTKNAAGLEALTCTPGTFAIAGQAATLRTHRELVAQPGAVTLSGQAATLAVGRALLASPGAVTISGQLATLRAARRLDAQPGAVTITGQNATLTYSEFVAGTPGPHPLSVEFTAISRTVEFTAITRAVEFTPITRTVEFTDG